tara:strand:+ start:9579 stop:10571 length:993 start_codon:yes stop_codon:yes gene_type:complete
MDSYLITGGAGYIGSHLVERLINKKKKVIVYDNLSTGSMLLLKKKVKFIKGDINNYKKLSQVLIKHKINTIFHFAAAINVAEAEINKKKYYKNNINGTKNLIKAINVSKLKVKNIIFASSCTVYGGAKNSITEESKIKPAGYYGYTKAISEKNIINFSNSIGCNYAILRYFNVAGASNSGNIGEINSKNGHLFKNIAIQSHKKIRKVYINGKNFKTRDGTCVRDYIHVVDLTDIHLKVLSYLNKKNKSLILNCGYGRGYSVLEIVNQASKIISNLYILFTKKRIGDVNSAFCSNKKIKKILNWKPKNNNIKLMLTSAINWEKKLFNLKQK